jgi:hypothetical protein
MVAAPTRYDNGGMTKFTNRNDEQHAPRRARGFASQLIYLVVVATIFNLAALAAVAVASPLAAPGQVLVGAALLAMLVVASVGVVRGLRYFA